jgi:hypothetical protein
MAKVEVTADQARRLRTLAGELHRESRFVAASLVAGIAAQVQMDEPERCASPTCEFAPVYAVDVRLGRKQVEIVVCPMHLKLMAYHPYHQAVLGRRVGDIRRLDESAVAVHK